MEGIREGETPIRQIGGAKRGGGHFIGVSC